MFLIFINEVKSVGFIYKKPYQNIKSTNGTSRSGFTLNLFSRSRRGALPVLKPGTIASLRKLLYRSSVASFIVSCGISTITFFLQGPASSIVTVFFNVSVCGSSVSGCCSSSTDGCYSSRESWGTCKDRCGMINGTYKKNGLSLLFRINFKASFAIRSCEYWSPCTLWLFG